MMNSQEYIISTILYAKFSIKTKINNNNNNNNNKSSIIYNLFNNTSASDLKAFRMMGR